MNLRKIISYLLIFAAAAGFIFCIVGLAEIWLIRPTLTKTAVDNLALMDQALSTTQEALTVAAQVVQTTHADVAGLQTTTQALTQTLHDANPMLDSLTNLTHKSFPDSIRAAQSSLTSAEGSALLIDNTLAVLTSIPFSPLTPYKPDVPLHTALADLSNSLNSLTPALDNISSSLVAGKTNLKSTADALNQISNITQGISSELDHAQSVIDQYQTVTTQLKAQVDTAQRAAPGWITTIAVILSLILVYSIVAQLSLALQGLEMLNRSSIII